MQALINGLASGLAIALFAAAFQIVYLPTRIFYIGLAGIYALAPFTALALAQWVPLPMAFLCAAVIGGGLSVGCEWMVHRPLARKEASDGAHLISSLGVYIVLSQLVQIGWGNQSQVFAVSSGAAFEAGDVFVTQGQAATVLASVVLLATLAFALRLTQIGVRLRALADSPKRFELLGYNVDFHRAAAFAIAGVYASAASLLAAYDIGFDPHRGLPALLIGVVAVIVGGRSSFGAPIGAALLLGILQSQMRWHFSSNLVDAMTFAILAACLLLAPEGLFGRRRRIEA